MSGAALGDAPSPPLRLPHILVAFVVLCAFATFRRRELWELFQGSGIDDEIKAKLALWLLLGLVSACCWSVVSRNSHLLFTAPLAPYAAFVFVALVSTLYSEQPALTCFRAAQLVVVLALVLAAADRVDRWPEIALIYLGLNWAFLAIGLTGFLPSLHWRELPAYQEPGYDGFHAPWRFGTPIGHFSQISIIAAMAAIAVAARLRGAPKLSELAVLVWLLATVLLTVSRTGIAGLLLGLLVVAALRGKLAVTALAGVTICGPALALPPVTEAIKRFLERGQDVDDLASLTGRTGIYESALQSLGDDWLLGHGFRATRAAKLNEVVDSAGNSHGTAAHAHNAVLEAISGLGVAGGLAAVLLLVAFAACAVGMLLRRRGPKDRRSREVEFMALFAPLLVFSILDSSFALEINPYNVFLIAGLVDFANHRSRLAANGARLENPPLDRDPPERRPNPHGR